MAWPNINRMMNAIPTNLMKEFLKNSIESILRNNDGGIKLTALVCEITSKLCENGYDVPEHLLSDIDQIILDHRDIHTVEYLANVTDSVPKIRKFIFFVTK